MKMRNLTAAGLALFLTFGHVPRQVPLSEFVGPTAVLADQCSKYSLCVWVNFLIYKLELCIENEHCPQGEG